MIYTDLSSVYTPLRVNSALEKCGLDECSKELHLFYDKSIINPVFQNKGKAILLNQSLSFTDKVIDRSAVRNKHSKLLLLNLYEFDVDFGNLPPTAWQNAVFTLTNAYSNSETIDYDYEHHMKNGESVYKSVPEVLGSDSYMIKDALSNIETSNIVIPLPKYYSLEHMDRNNEYTSTLNEYDTLEYYGYEIVDKRRTIVFTHNISDWVHFKSKYDKVMEEEAITPNKLADVDNMAADLFVVSAPAMIEGVVYAYDTLGKYKKFGTGIGNLNTKAQMFSMNNIQPNTPFAKHRLKNNLNWHTEQILKTIDKIGEKASEEFGTVELFYAPRKYGDRIKMIFHDYNKNNQPIKTNGVNKILKTTSNENNIDSYISNVLINNSQDLYFE